MNKINPKAESNSKLLQLLAKRSRNEIIKFKEESWPGKKRPSFTSTIRIQSMRNTQSEAKLPSKRKSSVSHTTYKANEIVSSSKSLALIPKSNTRAEENKVRSLTGRANPAKNIFHSSQNKVRNVQALSRVSRRSGYDQLDNYQIDYMAFNYIGKVIDTPDLWTKFIHKKQGAL